MLAICYPFQVSSGIYPGLHQGNGSIQCDHLGCNNVHYAYNNRASKNRYRNMIIQTFPHTL